MSNAVIALFTLGLGVLIATTLIVRGNADAGSPDPLAVSIAITDQHTGQRLSQVKPRELALTPPAGGVPVISVDDSEHQQKITGFGADVTGESANLIEGLNNDRRYHLLADLFTDTYGDLNVIRLPMGVSNLGNDSTNDTYDDGTVDPDLSRFSVEADRQAIIPALKQSLTHNYGIRFLATPWTMPAWMKANGALSNAGNSGTLLKQYGAAYAQYFVKYIQAYAKSGITISAVTPADEPGTPTSGPGMNISAAEEVKLIDDYLIPALRSAGLQTRVYGGDLNWYDSSYAATIATSPAAEQVIGVAYHCYFGNPYVMSEVHDDDTMLGSIVSECSPSESRVPVAESIIGSLRNWASQVDLGNLAVPGTGSDQTGPQKHTAGASGLISINPATGGWYRNESYYELAQASEFLQPGAYRVPTNTFVSYHYRKNRSYASAGVDNVAVANPDGSVALMAYNNASTSKTFAVEWHDLYFTYTLKPGATASFRWRLPNSTGSN